jgi:O-methyltransferase
MRRAYLELLKLSLCDLAASGSTSVGRTADGGVFSRELTGDQLRLRAAGMDWPAHGLTMVGLRRLDDLQACVESIVADGIEGDLIEAGAWRGGASILMRATLDSLGASERTVWVADSFAGFPAGADGTADGDDLAVFDFLAIPVEEAQANFARLGLEHGVRFIEGFFDQTLPPLRDHSWSLVRLDGDTYGATQLALRSLYPGLAVGGYLIVDDYGALEGCAAAVEDFRREHGISEPFEQVDWTGVRWRRERTGSAIAEPAAGDGAQPAARHVSRGGRSPVPTLDELALREELEALRARLARAEAELGAPSESRWMKLGERIRMVARGARR